MFINLSLTFIEIKKGCDCVCRVDMCFAEWFHRKVFCMCTRVCPDGIDKKNKRDRLNYNLENTWCFFLFRFLIPGVRQTYCNCDKLLMKRKNIISFWAWWLTFYTAISMPSYLPFDHPLENLYFLPCIRGVIF